MPRRKKKPGLPVEGALLTAANRRRATVGLPSVDGTNKKRATGGLFGPTIPFAEERERLLTMSQERIKALQGFLAGQRQQLVAPTGQIDDATITAYGQARYRTGAISDFVQARTAYGNRQELNVKAAKDAGRARDGLGALLRDVSDKQGQKELGLTPGSKAADKFVKRLKEILTTGDDYAVVSTFDALRKDLGDERFAPALPARSRAVQANLREIQKGLEDRPGVSGEALTDAQLRDVQKVLQAKRTGGVKADSGSTVKPVIDFVEGVTEPIMRAYYAAKYAEGQGADFGTQLETLFTSLPGVNQLDIRSDEAKAFNEATNSRMERELLTQQGQLASFGEYVTGKAADVLKGKARQRYLDSAMAGVSFAGGSGKQGFGFGVTPRQTGVGRRANTGILDVAFGPGSSQNVASAITDLTFTVASDPTFALGKGISALKTPLGAAGEAGVKGAARRGAFTGLAGEELSAAVRENFARGVTRWLTESKVGQALTKAVDDALAIGLHDEGAVGRALRGMPSRYAERIANAATEAEARQIVYEAMTVGAWNPTVRPLVNQLPLSFGGGTIGRSAVSTTERLAWLRRLANEDTVIRSVLSTPSAKRASEAIVIALREADNPSLRRIGDFVDKVVKPGTKGDFGDRLFTALNKITGDNQGLNEWAEKKLRPFLTGKNVRSPQDLSRLFAGLVTDKKFTQALEEIEAAAAIAAGEAGENARRRLLVEFGEGFRAKPSTVGGIVAQARGNVASGVGKAVDDGVPDWLADLRIEQLPPTLKEKVTLSLARNKGTKGLRAAVKQLVDNPDIAAEAERLIQRENARLADQATEGVKGLGRRGFRAKVARGILDIVESAPTNDIGLNPTHTDALSRQERIARIDRLAGAFRLDDAARTQLRIEAARVKTEEDLFRLAARPLELAGQRAGVDRNILQTILKEAQSGYSATKSGRVFGIDEFGEAITEVQTLAQRIEKVPLPQPEELVRAIREEFARADQWSARKVFANMRIGLTKTGDLQIIGLSRLGKPLTVRLLLGDGHRLWKFMIVTNAYMPILGAVGGAVGLLEGGIEGGAALGAVAAGVLAPTRYIMRVAGIEENLRKVLERGFSPIEFTPGLSREAAEGAIPLAHRFNDYSLTRSGGWEGPAWENRFFITPGDSGWETVALKGTNRRSIDAWYRVVRYQLQPEVYEVERILLSVRAGLHSHEEGLDALLRLQATEAGQEWFKRFKGGIGGPKNWDEAVERTRLFIERNTTPEVALGRLNSIDEQALRERLIAAVKNGDEGVPRLVHVQKRASSKASGLLRSYNEVTSRGVFEFPTSHMNRNPLARWTYSDEYGRLTRAGMSPEQASEIAAERAVQRTNEVMFRIDGESRFARKADYIFPFQQPREEFFRVYAKLIANNPGRVFRTVRLAAIAFNNGQNEGIFKKDPLSGEWEMSIPGSSTLSNLLFGHAGGFDINLRDLSMLGQGGALGVGIFPSPGGPYWSIFSRLLVDKYPEFFEQDTLFTKWLLPYGPGRDLFRPEARRLWMGLTGGSPPWLFWNDTEADQEFEKYKIEVARSLYAANVREGKPADKAWPSDQEVEDSTRAFFRAWSLWGSISPATPRPSFFGREQFNALTKYLSGDGKLSFSSQDVLAKRPELAPYMQTDSEYTGPEDWEHFVNPLERNKEFSLRYRETVTYDKFKEDFAKYQREAKAYAERENIFNIPHNDPQYQKKFDEWEEKYPDIANDSRDNYRRDRDLAKILATVPKKDQPDALNDWRRRYDVSNANYNRLRDTVPKTWAINPWKEARAGDVIWKDVRKNVRAGVNEDVYVSSLAPAEQVIYWDTKIDRLNEDWTPTDDPADVLQKYYDFQRKKNLVRSTNPILNLSNDNEFEKFVGQLHADEAKALSDIYTEAARLKTGIDQAYAAGNYSAGKALSDKRNSLFTLATAIRDSLYKKVPDLGVAVDTLREIALAGEAKDKNKLRRLNARLEKERNLAGFVPVNQELSFLSMPENVQTAYIEKLQRSLDFPSTRGASQELRGLLKSEGYTKLFWDWLPQWQQDLLENNLGEDKVNEWRAQSYEAGYNKPKVLPDGTPADVAWALEMMKHYDQRGAKPGGLKDYLNLPSNPILRSDFLAKNPDVAAWVQGNPLLLMPEPHRSIAVSTLNRYSNHGGGGGGGNPELSFAFSQLKAWNRRPDGSNAPDTYNLWVNMPTGPEKAAYLKAHPEIGDWLRLGPMSNMPDEYREVVRDIMLRYGKWTERNDDPLGQTINGYYKTPAWAREQYLKDHPELLEYWKAIRSPEEARLAALAEQYFSIQSPTAKRLFLASNPELQQYFLDGRTKRYNRFLSRVAQYMGQNPEMFTRYLERQEEILSELLKRFGEATLVRESYEIRDGGAQSGPSGDGNRRRRGTQPRAA